MQNKDLRDEFAMAALTGMLAKIEECRAEPNSIAIAAYQFADAMLAAKKKTLKDKVGAK